MMKTGKNYTFAKCGAMSKSKITNPIYFELKKLNLINDKNLILISSKTRDKKMKVFKDKKTKLIFLEKYISNQNYYSSLNYPKVTKKKTLIVNIKTNKGMIKSEKINNNIIRAKLYNKLLKKKNILDFGCGWGEFLNNLSGTASRNGIELRQECLNYIKKNFKKINVQNNLNFFKKKFDVITMFHVLEHIPYQVKTLKLLKSKLKKKGKIIIEVPHAEDFLILQDELKEFKEFNFWSEHLILHTFKSLKKTLIKAGFKKIKINFYQRYDFCNHLGWFLKKKPGGQVFYRKFINKKLNSLYIENLIKLKQTDTLIATAEK